MRTTRQRLAARRNLLGLTQEALAEKLDVAVSTVARWEQGATAPRAWQRRPLADVLGVSLAQLDELLLVAGPGSDAEVVAEPAGAPGDPAAQPAGTLAAAAVVERPAGPVLARSAGNHVPRPEVFVDRAAERGAIVAALQERRVVAVVGRRGVGTSVCAWEAVHQASDHDRTLRAVYLDLRPGRRARPLEQALADLGRDAGLDPAAVRTALATGHDLLVIDNIDDHEAVRALAPSIVPCRLLLIGTPELARLSDVHTVPLAEPSPAQATAMFERAWARAGGPAASPAGSGLRELVDLCGRQPRVVMALARSAARGSLNLDGALETLRRAAAAPPHHAVHLFVAATALAPEDVAYAALRPKARRLFRRLALAPERLAGDAVLEAVDGSSRCLLEGELAPQPLALEAMARLAGTSIARVAELVDELCRARFIQPVPSVASAEIEEGGRYEIRPLLAASARIHLRHDEPARRRVRALVALTRHLARRSEWHASRPSVASRGWFACHEPLLAAMVALPATRVGDGTVSLPRPLRRWWFRLAGALCVWYAEEGRLDEWWAACEAVRRGVPGRPPRIVGWFRNDLGTLRGRPQVTCWVHNEQGVILRRRGDPRAAIGELNLALPRRRRRGRRGEAQVLTNRGLAFLDLEALDAAIADFKRAAQRRSPRDKVGIGLTELGLGVAYLRSGAASDARRHLVKAADAFDRADELRGSATARTNLVLAEWETGARQAALECGEVALDKYAALERLTGRDESEGRATVLRNIELCRSPARG